MKKQNYKSLAALLIVFLMPFTALAQAVDPGFNPSKLIEDSIFSDTQTFGGPAGIQKFLESKNSPLANTNSAFLVKLKEPDVQMLKQGLEDPQPNLGRLRTAAELIWDASVQSGLNPQVILTTLNKEQSLITGRQNASENEMQKALNNAMGFDCPDATGCGNILPGFYFQLFGNYDSQGNRYLGAARSLMKSFNTSGGRGPQFNGSVSKVGDTITLDNNTGGPFNAPPNQILTLGNRATAALYRYTPHVFNGNYNFWRFFNAWFRYANGTLLSLANDAKTYIIQNGTRQLVPNFVAQARGLNIASKIIASPNELESYPVDKVYGPADNTIIKNPADNSQYVFIANIKHPVSDFVLNQRGLNPATALVVSADELTMFDAGNVLPPADGTVIKGKKDAAVYLVDQGTIKLFSGYTFTQRKIAAKNVVQVPDEEITTYQKNGYVAPLDNTLIKAQGSAAVYVVEKGLKRPILADIFKIRAFAVKNVATLSTEEVSALPIGAYATPKDRTFFKVSETGDIFMFKEGSKHQISSYVAKQRGMTPDYTFSQAVTIEWFDGIPVPPKDVTVVKGDKNGTVYLVTGGQLRPLTAAAFKNRKYTAKKIVTLPQVEIDSYAKGETLLK